MEAISWSSLTLRTETRLLNWSKRGFTGWYLGWGRGVHRAHRSQGSQAQGRQEPSKIPEAKKRGAMHSNHLMTGTACQGPLLQGWPCTDSGQDPGRDSPGSWGGGGHPKNHPTNSYTQWGGENTPVRSQVAIGEINTMNICYRFILHMLLCNLHFNTSWTIFLCSCILT